MSSSAFGAQVSTELRVFSFLIFFDTVSGTESGTEFFLPRRNRQRSSKPTMAGGIMKAKKDYIFAGLAAAVLYMAPQMAQAEDNYYAVLEPRTAIPERYEATTMVETTALSYPVVIERTTTTSAVTLEPSKIPCVLDRTSTVPPPRLFQFRAGW